MGVNIFPSANKKYSAHISRGASGNSLFTTQKIDLYVSIYSNDDDDDDWCFMATSVYRVG